jgi:hypothetical protein
MTQVFGGQFFGGDFFAAASTSGDFFNGPFFNGNFFNGTAPEPEATPTGGGSYNQYSRATGRLKFEIPRLPLRPKPKGKKKQEPEQVAADSLQYIAEQLKLPENPPYADELLALFVDLIEKQKQLTERQRQREMVAAFLEMEEMEAEAELLLLAH